MKTTTNRKKDKQDPNTTQYDGDKISDMVFSSIERGDGFCNPIRNKIEWEQEDDEE